MDGVGLFPSPQAPTTISSKLQSNSMAIITFTNPLSHSASFDINLNKQNDVFCLFLKQSKDVIVESGVSLDIPIMFAPDSMRMTYTELIISTDEVMESDDPITWIYPVHGLPETLVKNNYNLLVDNIQLYPLQILFNLHHLAVKTFTVFISSLLLGIRLQCMQQQLKYLNKI